MNAEQTAGTGHRDLTCGFWYFICVPGFPAGHGFEPTLEKSVILENTNKKKKLIYFKKNTLYLFT
ncbi:hypothetical protein JI735_22950 [Paenibacillus sonchi]|uniref:Uncharacterized protein n=2 Tax=Paenibacillus sonchi TaxID=373687 RepID=A0A974SCQ2_9BACL|nr:hypothetical protein [Paenibacillus sonchi]QQZ59485.1 hypothetical protein JI735_22950 [Paenibacillus sonchi]